MVRVELEKEDVVGVNIGEGSGDLEESVAKHSHHRVTRAFMDEGDSDSLWPLAKLIKPNGGYPDLLLHHHRQSEHCPLQPERILPYQRDHQ